MQQPTADQVFAIRERGEPVWKALVSGNVAAACWPDKGSALAGMRTEQRRQARRAATAAIA